MVDYSGMMLIPDLIKIRPFAHDLFCENNTSMTNTSTI